MSTTYLKSSPRYISQIFDNKSIHTYIFNISFVSIMKPALVSNM